MNAAPAPAQLSDRFRHIVIEGPIGVGKSSLARRLAEHLGAEMLLEKADDNPFLERFYDDRFGYAFQTQLFFLFQRVQQMHTLPISICCSTSCRPSWADAASTIRRRELHCAGFKFTTPA